MKLLEREACLAELEAALARAATGAGCIALVSGEAGIGKTSLVQVFTSLRSKLPVYWGAHDSLCITSI
jgi:predicted ATPase